MRKILVVVAGLLLALSLGSMAASAQTQVTLGPTASGSIDFVGSSGTVSINLGCVGLTCSGTLNGLPANGTDSYTMVQTGSIILNSNGSVTQANPISFSYNNGTGGTLTGNLELVNFVQLPAPANGLGVFGTGLVANLTNLGGTLVNCSNCSFSNPGAGIASVLIDIQHGSSVAGLFSSNGVVFANVSAGEIVPTPESSTLLLFGTGLLAVGAILWRRNGAQLLATRA
ncbi:MAG: PEP-CTERM sorting domain-containing protein [Acidobacteriia bacterium]|nr:PEP-CTERM sorting domain-containing protein [Terriglobia bacterium]